jgi:dTMP kinase
MSDATFGERDLGGALWRAVGADGREAKSMYGRFITFEGGEGAGKSTQAKLLAARLESLGIGVLVTREPGGSPGAEVIRHVLLSGAAQPLGAYAETLLLAAARDDHLRQTIRPALARGQWVICDRFADSTRVYQGTLSNVDHRLIGALERITVGDTKPELTIVLDLPAELGLGRAAKRRGSARRDRFEREDLELHKKLREAYLGLAQREPSRCVVVDARADPAAVAETVWAMVSARVGPLKAQIPAKGAPP